MFAFHDTHEYAFRKPLGGLVLGESVKLALRVQPDEGVSAVCVKLRTWVDGKGESIYEMSAAPGNTGLFDIEYTPSEAGVVWYQFIIELSDGRTVRYGARDGQLGGEGELRDWEPPSFKLSVGEAVGEGFAEGWMQEAGEGGHSSTSLLVDALVAFVCGKSSAPAFADAYWTMREDMPEPTFKRVLEAFGSFGNDKLYELIAADDPNPAKGRLWCATLVQTLLSCTETTQESAQDAEALAEGDQATTSGAPYDRDCVAIADNVRDVLRTLLQAGEGADPGYARLEAVNDDVIAVWIGDACLLVNGSLYNAHDVGVAMPGGAEAVSEVIGGYGVSVVDGQARVHLYQLGTAILLFHARERLQRPLAPGLGALAHITSLPTGAKSSKGTRQKPGTLGAPARDFVDWLSSRDMRYWQVLPVNPTDDYGSPYAGISAFAGNTLIMERPKDSTRGKARKGESGNAVANFDIPEEDMPAYRAFCEREADWLDPYACFTAIRRQVGEGVVWQDWPKKYRTFDPGIIQKDKKLSAFAEECRREQFEFEKQWSDVRAYANERGIQIIGDMPIYVSSDSADVWANPEIFQLDASGRPGIVAGCPPDSFAVDGQVWGNPVYDWDALREGGYAWWLRRLKRAFELYDVVRLDHFIGFMRYFAIPAGEKATEGVYRPGPGLDLFNRAFERFGALPIIAEDLGSITPAVRLLVAQCGFPGMDVIQFVDGNDPLSGYRPRPEKVAYTGTHDNQTLVGYCAERYPDLEAKETAARLMQAVKTCDSDVRILPLQDILGLDDEARMNVPGTADGNWTWQARPCDLWG